jgi:conserved hypothetical protein, YceG family
MSTHQKAAVGLARFLGVAASALLLGLVAVALAFALAMRPAAGIGEGSLFTVGKGESAQQVGQRLEEKGLIRSALAFKILAKIEGKGSGLKAGSYRIEPGMGANRILDELVSGRQALVRVTVPEGYTLGQIAALFDRLGLAKKDEFLAAARSPKLLSDLGIPGSSAEGYLFPDTYYFPAAFSPEAALETMARNFRSKLATIPEAASLSPAELADRIILASIVEREYKSEEEAPLMASVFYNRLKIKMALQSCATVVYVITEREGKPHPEVIYDRDLKIDDPYNTYEHRGLPPGPISNPGMTALMAVFHPASSKYLYFRLVNPDAGTHHFSSTMEEHLNAATLFIKKVGG